MSARENLYFHPVIRAKRCVPDVQTTDDIFQNFGDFQGKNLQIFGVTILYHFLSQNVKICKLLGLTFFDTSGHFPFSEK